MISGAHTAGATGTVEPNHIHYWNDGYIGIENEGNYISEDPPGALWDSRVLLCAHIVSRYCFWPLRMLGHRDFNATACPSQMLYNQIGSQRANVSTPQRGQVTW
jgi:hypothetical protein